MKKISRVAGVLLTIVVGVSGCGMKGDRVSENQNVLQEQQQSDEISLPAQEAKRTEVIHAGEFVVYLDEVRYYAYNTQATYEAYYMAEEKELDWNYTLEEGMTLEEAVKSTVLDAICEREAIVSYADAYHVTFTERELMKVKEKVDKYYAESNANLLERTDVERERLKEIFQKDAFYQKVKQAMEKEENGKSEIVYNNWKKENNVTTNQYWDAIHFQEPIL